MPILPIRRLCLRQTRRGICSPAAPRSVTGKDVTDTEAGYIAKLGEVPKSPKTGDNSYVSLCVMLPALSSIGLCACLVLGKKKKYSR